jgi:hypothetical protein
MDAIRVTYIYTFRNEAGHEVKVVASHLDEAVAKASPLCPGGMEPVKRTTISLARKDLGIKQGKQGGEG